MEKQGRDDGQQQGGDHDGRGIDRGKPGDEIFGTGFFVGGVFHQLQNAGDGGFSERFRYTDLQQTVQVDGSAVDLFIRADPARDGFSGQRGSVQTGLPFNNNTVERYPFTGFDQDEIPDLHFVRVDFLNAVIGDFVGILRAHVHHGSDGIARFPDGVVFEKFTDLVEKHDRNGFLEIPQTDGADGCDAHQKVFIENLPVTDIPRGLHQDLAADDEIGRKIQNRLQDLRGLLRKDLFKRKDQCEQIDPRADQDRLQFILLPFAHGPVLFCTAAGLSEAG